MATINQNTTDLQAILNLANSLPEKVDTSGTATAADIYTGKTATVNDQKITGTNPYNAANVDPAVTSALTALADKGVDTTGADLFDLADLIAAIEAGGGGAITTGTFTPASSATATITHGLGVVPKYFWIWAPRTSSKFTNAIHNAFGTDSEQLHVYTNSNTSGYTAYVTYKNEGITVSSDTASINNTVALFSATQQTIEVGNLKASIYLKVGTSYNWLAIGG